MLDRNTKKKKGGYSLIETMIAVTIFTIIVVVVVDTLLVAQSAAIKIGLERAAMENVALSIESMTKEIRQGYSFRCDSAPASYAPARDCLTGGTKLSFRGQDDKYIVFRYNSTDELIEVYKEASGFPTGVGVGSYFLPLTSPEVEVKSLEFRAKGTSLEDDFQPFITITMTGVAKFGEGEALETDFFIQTSISPRLLDT